MIGFGMPELIMIAVILGIVAVIIVFRKGGRQQTNINPAYSNASAVASPTAPQRLVENRGPIKRPSFGSYLLVFIFPPGYFFSRKRIAAGIFSLILLFVSIPFFLLFGIGIFIWFGNATWAAFNLRYELMNVHIKEQARAIAEEMASQRNVT